MNKSIIVSFIFAFSAFCVSAQYSKIELNGTVLDEISQAGLHYADVTFSSLENRSVYRTLSTNNGDFEIKGMSIGYYSIRVEYVGYDIYKRDSILIDSSKEIVKIFPVFLQLTQKELAGVTVKSIKPFIVQLPDKTIPNMFGCPVANSSNIEQRIGFYSFENLSSLQELYNMDKIFLPYKMQFLYLKR